MRTQLSAAALFFRPYKPEARAKERPSLALQACVTCLLAALFPGLAAAVGFPKPAAPRELQDFVFLGDKRPVLVRLHVQIDGQPFEATWNDFMRQLFDYFDLNGDGVLSKGEVERAPAAQILQFMTQGSIGFPGGRGNKVQMDQMDTNKDGKVTREEFAAYYRKNGFGPVHFGFGPDKGTADKLTDALFLHLDKNKDGRLSKEEVAVAAEVLHKLDLDEDEMITATELAPGLFGYMPEFYYRGSEQAGATAFDANGVLMILPRESHGRITKKLLERYDKDKNRKLSLQESGLDRAAFDRLDANKDGQLDEGELTKWLEGPPDLELIVRLGTLVPSKTQGNFLGAIASQLGKTVVAAVDVVGPKDRTSPFANTVKKESGGTLLVTLGDARIELAHTDNQRVAFGGNKQFYLQQFKTIAGKKGYIDAVEAMVSPYFGRGLFDFADRDGDGKLYEKELITFLDLQNKGGASFTTLTLTDYGRGLFDLIDTNGDGRLGLRELRTAWTRLAPFVPEGKDGISRDDVPRRFQLMVSQGNTYFGSRFGNVNGRRNQSAMQSIFGNKAGPLWFRKMDRNGDGDVSPQEFLGSPEDFKRIDTDGDGLIDAKEAAQADVWFRKKLEAKGK
jgi:Ca2+-binding EF-hand superfamily protein